MAKTGKRKTAATRNKKHIRTRRPTASNQKKQIASNQNQILSIKRHLNLSKQRMRFHMGFTEHALNTYPYIVPLSNGPSTSTPAVTNGTTPVSCVWNTTMTPAPQDLNTSRSKCVINTQWVDLSITGGTEPNPLYHTVFLVQLQEDCAEQVYAETASMSSLVRDVDYVTPLNGLLDSGYGAYMNSSRFKIIKRMEFSTIAANIGWPGGPPSDNSGAGLGAAVRRTQFKINYGNTVFKSSGSGSSLQSLEYSELDPSKKRFLVIFNDNALTDGEYPNIAVSSLITGYAAE